MAKASTISHEIDRASRSSEKFSEKIKILRIKLDLIFLDFSIPSEMTGKFLY